MSVAFQRSTAVETVCIGSRLKELLQWPFQSAAEHQAQLFSELYITQVAHACACVSRIMSLKGTMLEWGGQNQQISFDFTLRNFVIRPDMCGPPSPERDSDRPTEPPRTRLDQTKQRTLQHRSSGASDFHFKILSYLIAFVAGLSALSSFTRGPLCRQTTQA